jgi:hypothetical protein
MRNAMRLAGLSLVVLGISVIANEKPSADFQQAMKENGAALQKLAKDVEAKDFDAIAAGAGTLKKNFQGPVGKYFADKKMDDALKQCTAAFQAADNLEKAAKAKDEMQVADARRAVQGACGGCHMAHREQMPDKSYEIK